MTRAKRDVQASKRPAEPEQRTFAVESLSRVEGEGRLKVVVRGSEVVSAELSIFEAPRVPRLRTRSI